MASVEDEPVAEPNEEETFLGLTIRYFEERWLDETQNVVHLCQLSLGPDVLLCLR